MRELQGSVPIRSLTGIRAVEVASGKSEYISRDTRCRKKMGWTNCTDGKNV